MCTYWETTLHQVLFCNQEAAESRCPMEKRGRGTKCGQSRVHRQGKEGLRDLGSMRLQCGWARLG